MSQIVIRDIHTINVKNIKLLEDKSYIKLRYEYKKNIFIIGISFKVPQCELILHNHYYSLLVNHTDLSQIKVVENFLHHNIPYYKTFIKDNKISFCKNVYLDNFYHSYKGKKRDIILMIKYVKKGQDYYPIIHIQDGSQN